MSSDKSVDGGCDAFNTFFLETGADKQFHRCVYNQTSLVLVEIILSN